MLTVSTPDLELMQVSLGRDPEYQRVNVAFPISRETGAEHTAIVYFEIAPGERLASHTDSAEEILYIVSGDAEAEVGDERGRVRAGDLAVIPAMAPHGLIEHRRRAREGRRVLLRGRGHVDLRGAARAARRRPARHRRRGRRRLTPSARPDGGPGPNPAGQSCVASVGSPSSWRPVSSQVAGATSMCCVAALTSRRRRCSGLES